MTMVHILEVIVGVVVVLLGGVYYYLVTHSMD
jgi:hypothetical protein